MKPPKLFPRLLIFLEVLAVFLILWASGSVLSEEDPFALKQKYSPTMLVALVLSLYYGFMGGILFLAAVFAVAFFYYKPFPYLQFLWELLIVLIASEFRYYWGRRVRSAEREKEYLEEQVSRLRKELFLLKLSHDQLELNYVIKPYSLRRMLEEIKQKLITERNEKVLMNFLLSILMQNFQVYGATLFKYSGGRLEVLAQLGNDKEPTLEEPLLRRAIEEESSFYLPPKALKKFTGEKRGFRYLAVIVSKAEGELYILAISDILFVNLNEEVLNYMLIILSYVAEDVAIGRKLASLYAGREVMCNFNFLKELFKMYELFEELGIESSVVVFTWQEGISPHHEYEFERAIRGLDVMCFLYERRLVLFLLPFTAYAGAVSFSERMRKLFPELKLLGIKRVESGELWYYLPKEER